MTHRTRCLAFFTVVSLSALAAADDRPGGVAIRVRDEAGKHPVFEVTGLSPAALATFERDPKQAEAALKVVTVNHWTSVPKSQWPTVLGTYQVDVAARVLRFTMRFPAEPKLTYSATYRPDGAKTDHATIDLFLTPPEIKDLPTMVHSVSPGYTPLPENLLKFYIQFSAPMSRGHAYEHLKLLDEQGKPLELPFLELGEELWDRRGMRFTLLFDPGRIKREVKPRVDLGPVLQAGKSYTLVIEKTWLDAKSRPLFGDVCKGFKAGPADVTPPDPKTWTVIVPAAGTRNRLHVYFPEALDHALLERCLVVAGVDGTTAVGGTDRAWEFRPDDPWKPGSYEILIDPTLEDLAGNSIGRPFDVDVFEKIEPSRGAGPVRLPFQIGGSK